MLRPRFPDDLPDVDERLVMPETRYEAVDGEITYVCPADEPHGTYHSKLAALLEAYIAAAYSAAVDMLTRTSAKNDMAPDASVFPTARDASTGGRRLEELAFEIVSTETLAHAGKKAKALADRGVRRVFAIDLDRRRALEWSRETDAWEILGPDAAITDATLALPLPLRDLTDAARSDDAVARALLAKRNPVIDRALEGARNEGERDGRVQGKLAALVTLLRARGLRVSKKTEQRLLSAREEARVDRWLTGAVSCASVEALLDP
jgi:Uma2 family endonuclease